MKSYRVRYERDEKGWWVAKVLDVPGCHTQGKSIKQARTRIREALDLFVKNAATAEFKEQVVMPVDARRLLTKTKAARRKADDASEKAQAATEEAVRVLTKRLKLSVRDAAELLELSHQRVQQLVR